MATASERTMEAASKFDSIGFVEFTTNLVRDVYRVIVEASMDQLKAYADFVAKIAKTVEEYEKEVVGETDADQTARADDYILNVLGFADNQGQVPDPISVKGQVEALKQHFLGMAIKVGAPGGEEEKTIDQLIEGIDTDNPSIKREDLRKFVIEKLGKNARESYDLIKTILKIGMQKVVVTSGEIHTKLTFHVDATDTYEKKQHEYSRNASSWGIRGSLGGRYGSPGGQIAGIMFGNFIGGGISGGYGESKFNVKVMNEKTAAATNVTVDILGEVRILFRTETFPTIEE